MRQKMRREDRAKQFAPFAALPGYDRALRAAGLPPKAPPPELAEEELERLDRAARRRAAGLPEDDLDWESLEEFLAK